MILKITKNANARTDYMFCTNVFEYYIFFIKFQTFLLKIKYVRGKHFSGLYSCFKRQILKTGYNEI